jgi:hypothetical protein
VDVPAQHEAHVLVRPAGKRRIDLRDDAALSAFMVDDGWTKT